MAASEPDTGEDLPVQLRATVVEYDDAPDECTIYPQDVSHWDRMTTWITAEEGSYVDLTSLR